MKKFTSLLLAAVLGASLLVGCGASSTDSAATTATTETAATEATTDAATPLTLNLGLTSDMETYDVHMTTADYFAPINVFDRLFEIKIKDGAAVLENSLVSDYSVSDDGLVFDFTLRDDVLFSDGAKLTADDVAYTFTRMVALESSEQEYLFESVEGYEDFTGTNNYSDGYLTGITVTDDTHLTITLSKPYAGFLNILASPACSIYEKAVVEAAGEAFGTDAQYAIGSGAYTLANWTRDASVVYEYNTNYWGETPDFTTVNVQIIPDADTLSMMFQAGQIDILDADNLDATVVAATYKTGFADKMVVSNRLGTTYLSLNNASATLSDVVARQAVQMMIDRQTIIDTILDGDGKTVDGIYPDGLVGFTTANQGWLKYDPAAAQALLEDAGYTKDADGYYFSFVIANDENNSATRQLVIQVVQQQLQEAGINCTIENYDHSSWLALRRAGEIDAYVSTWTADYNDPDNFIATFFGSEGSTTGRSICYQDTDIMDRVSAAPAIADEKTRLAEYAELEKKIVEEDAAWVPLYQGTHLFFTSTNVSEFVPHWAGYADFQYKDVKAAK